MNLQCYRNRLHSQLDVDLFRLGHFPVLPLLYRQLLPNKKKENPDIQGKKLAVFTCFSGGGADKVIEKMEKYIGIEEFEAELILVDPKENVKAENDEKIDVFCDMVKQNGK